MRGNALGSNYVYYKFGDNSTDKWSGEFTFRIPPAAGTQPNDRPTRIVLYDDMGRGSLDQSYTWNEYGRPSMYTAMSVGAEVLKGNVDAVYHGGDVSYATGYLAVWDFYLDMLSPVSSGAVYLTTVGNHESDWPNKTYYESNDSGGMYVQIKLRSKIFEFT
jgi:acid phosphatase type 7